jgi:protocatechuate 3,4-dioxygenase alpha subunit
MHAATASQTIGPYWHLLDDPGWADLTRFGAEGERIVLTGAITDGEGLPVGDACVELWQASPAASASFPGFGRCATDAAGRFRFVTLKPGPVPGRGNTRQAPHLALCIMARGLMGGLVTRAYFEGEALNEADPVLSSVEEPDRRATLIAKAEGAGMWRLDIRLQGGNETVFFEV